MVTDSHFEYANKVVKFSVILFKNGIFDMHGDSGEQHFVISHKIHHRRFEESFNRSILYKLIG